MACVLLASRAPVPQMADPPAGFVLSGLPRSRGCARLPLRSEPRSARGLSGCGKQCALMTTLLATGHQLTADHHPRLPARRDTILLARGHDCRPAKGKSDDGRRVGLGLQGSREYYVFACMQACTRASPDARRSRPKSCAVTRSTWLP